MLKVHIVVAAESSRHWLFTIPGTGVQRMYVHVQRLYFAWLLGTTAF